MPMGILYWVLLILAILAVVFGGAYPFVGYGFILVLFFLLGWKVFGPPLQ